MDVRNAEEAEIGRLAKIWFDGWQDAHADILSAELARLRTLESFEGSLRDALANVRVTGPVGAPVAFCIVKGEQLYQLYVAAESRGSGVAAALVADAEARLIENDAGLSAGRDPAFPLSPQASAVDQVLRPTALKSR